MTAGLRAPELRRGAGAAPRPRATSRGGPRRAGAAAPRRPAHGEAALSGGRASPEPCWERGSSEAAGSSAARRPERGQRLHTFATRAGARRQGGRRADRESRSGAEERARPPASAEQRRSLLLTHTGGGGGVGSWRRGEGARARARPRGGEPAGARGGGRGRGSHDDGRAGETRRLRGRGLACRPGSPARKRRSEQRLCARQCARGGLKRAPTRAGAACESERAQRGRKAACRLASHRRGRAPARLPRQREARGARQRVALCLGIAAAGSPTRLLPQFTNWRRGGLCGSCQGILGWVNGFATRRKRLVQANACSGRPPRAPAMGRAAGGPAHHGRSCGRSREGVPPRRNPLAIGALFTRVSIVRLGSPWWVLQSSLTLCAARDQRVPAGKSGRSLRLGAPPLLLIEGAARCRRRTRLTTHRVAWRVCDPNPINTAHARAAARRVGAVHLALAASLWEWPRWVPRGRRSVGGAAGSSPGSRAAPCARFGRGLGLGRLPG